MVDADPIDFVPGGDAPNTPGGGVGKAADELWDKIVGVFQTVFKIIVGLFAITVIVIVVKWVIDLFARRRR